MADLIAELAEVVTLLDDMQSWIGSRRPDTREAEEREQWDKIERAKKTLRTHHAELEAAVRDSQRLDYLQREVDEIGAFLLHNGKGSGSGFTGLGLQNTGRTLRQAIDCCIGADNAMRAEGGV